MIVVAASASIRSEAIKTEAVETFGRLMRENVSSGAILFRRACSPSLVDRIENDHGAVCIVGDRAALGEVVANGMTASLGVRRRLP